MLLVTQNNQQLNIPLGTILTGNSFKKIIVDKDEIDNFDHDWGKYKHLVLQTRIFSSSDLIIKQSND